MWPSDSVPFYRLPTKLSSLCRAQIPQQENPFLQTTHVLSLISCAIKRAIITCESFTKEEPHAETMPELIIWKPKESSFHLNFMAARRLHGPKVGDTLM